MPRTKNVALCAVKDCLKLVSSKGYCHAHYMRMRRYGDPELGVSRRLHEGCTVDGCEGAYQARGLCANHYARMRQKAIISTETAEQRQERLLVRATRRRQCARKSGKELSPYKSRQDGLRIDDLRHLISVSTDECVVWPHAKNADGYGAVTFNKKRMGAHRAALIMTAGEPPAQRLHCAHAPIICHNPSCVNPRHLRWATPSENALDRVLDGTI